MYIIKKMENQVTIQNLGGVVEYTICHFFEGAQGKGKRLQEITNFSHIYGWWGGWVLTIF